MNTRPLGGTRRESVGRKATASRLPAVGAWQRSIARTKRICVAAGTAAVFAACSADEPPSTVSAVGTPAVWTLDATPLLSIGKVNSSDPAYNLFRVLDVWLLPGGRLAIASRDETVKIFDRSGHYLSAFGRAGFGPTEFTDLRQTLKEGDSLLVALEFGRPRVSRWRLNGELVDEYRYPVGIALAGTEFAALDGGRIMAVASPSGARLRELVYENVSSTSGYRKIVTSSALIMFDYTGVDTIAVVPGWTTFYIEASRGYTNSPFNAIPCSFSKFCREISLNSVAS